MLKIKNVSKNFGTIKALDNVTFSVGKGEVAALLGENGAGKSTLLRIISGYLPADGGEVLIAGLNISAQRTEAQKKCGYVQEVSALYGDMSVYEFLLLVAGLRCIDGKEAEEKIKNAVKLLELEEVAAQRIETLSKGFKKRTELAAVLMSEPEILLLDEPTEGLDPNQKYAVRGIIKNYAKRHSVLLSTHTMEDVEAVAKHVILIHKGKIKADEKLENFKKIAGNSLLESFRKITGK